jgi:hypothetical protein
MLPCYEGAGVTNVRVPMRLPRAKASVLPAVSAPILRAFCEGWGTTTLPFKFSLPGPIYLSVTEE